MIAMQFAQKPLLFGAIAFLQAVHSEVFDRAFSPQILHMPVLLLGDIVRPHAQVGLLESRHFLHMPVLHPRLTAVPHLHRNPRDW
ncbi:hypothetical protein LH128_00155 [Sphingomonas sp. LH128]|nr:hypothetical protein LH128_00155 [Sphingomonas sp. LH128]